MPRKLLEDRLGEGSVESRVDNDNTLVGSRLASAAVTARVNEQKEERRQGENESGRKQGNWLRGQRRKSV